MTLSICSEFDKIAMFFVEVPDFAQVFIWKWCETHASSWSWIRTEHRGAILLVMDPEQQRELFQVFGFLEKPKGILEKPSEGLFL